MHLVIRADATSLTGAGHVARCLALAQAWLSAGFGSVQIRGQIDLPFLGARIQQMQISHCEEFDNSDYSGHVVVVDSYDLSIRQSLAKYASALKVLVDDIGGWIPHDVDVIWNPNAYGNAALYPSFSGELLTGRDFVPIRRDLPLWDGTNCRGAAVALGASQLPSMLSDAITFALRDNEVVRTGNVGGAGGSTADPVRPWADLVGCCFALVGGGTTTWEAAAVGIPAVVVTFADNQALVARWAAEAKVPTVHVGEQRSVEELARELRLAIAAARSMPVINDGSGLVARRLAAMARSHAL